MANNYSLVLFSGHSRAWGLDNSRNQKVAPGVERIKLCVCDKHDIETVSDSQRVYIVVPTL